MRRIFFSLALLGAAAATAQTASTFETPVLPTQDTAYVNFTQPGQDVGFANGLAYFPCVYDTSFGGYWAGGYAYSNERDTSTGSLANQYAAKTGRGYAGSAQYAVYFEPYAGVRKLRVTGAAQNQAVRGFYITNTTYAYRSMKNGDPFMGPRFGDSTSTDTTHKRPDFFKVVARGYRGGAFTTDSAEFFLADFRATSNANDYIVRDWTWFSLVPLGRVDSVDFRLVSSRNNSFGNLVPAYFAMDNLTTDESNTGVRATAGIADLKIYPNPAVSHLSILSGVADLQQLDVVDAAGRTVMTKACEGSKSETISVTQLAAGVYYLRATSLRGVAVHRFIKQ